MAINVQKYKNINSWIDDFERKFKAYQKKGKPFLLKKFIEAESWGKDIRKKDAEVQFYKKTIDYIHDSILVFEQFNHECKNIKKKKMA